ncbi:penicillin-binding transpeptidase domain-containing protein [Streptomyces sp. NPDC054841]
MRLIATLAERAVVEDSTGEQITVRRHPPLASILGRLASAGNATAGGLPLASDTLIGNKAGLQHAYDQQLQGAPGSAMAIVDATGALVRNLHNLKSPTPGKPVHSTLDPRIQTAVDQAIAGANKQTAVLVIQASTGHIVAAGNSPADGFNGAFSGTWAPGSTMKVITSAAILTKGVATSDTKAPCPANLTVGGRTFHNDGGESDTDATLADAFAMSCNTTFVSLGDKLDDGDLAHEAITAFGIGLPWKVGIPSVDGHVPKAPGTPARKAANTFGQGQVLMNPLAMASVAATVNTGSFHQPIIVKGLPTVKAAAPLPPTVHSGLKRMMRQVVTEGTATPALGDLSGVYAKTGTAEVANQSTSNGWVIAFRGDYAVACIVVGGGHGVESAGPITHSILSKVPDREHRPDL